MQRNIDFKCIDHFKCINVFFTKFCCSRNSYSSHIYRNIHVWILMIGLHCVRFVAALCSILACIDICIYILLKFKVPAHVVSKLKNNHRTLLFTLQVSFKSSWSNNCVTMSCCYFVIFIYMYIYIRYILAELNNPTMYVAL